MYQLYPTNYPSRNFSLSEEKFVNEELQTIRHEIVRKVMKLFNSVKGRQPAGSRASQTPCSCSPPLTWKPSARQIYA